MTTKRKNRGFTLIELLVGKHDTAQSDCALLRVYCAEFLKNWLHWTDILGIINSNSK